MHIIIGGTGHIGSALASALLQRGEAVTIVSRSDKARAGWEQKGAAVAVCDVLDVDGMRRILARGKRAFVLNPPADPSTDIAVEERKTAAALVAALQGSGLQHVVLESTYGAQPGGAIGDLSVLYELEQAVRNTDVPASIIRGAYYMSNWQAFVEGARKGSLMTLFPADFRLPMVAPEDIAQVAAQLLTGPAQASGPHFVEGPERYTPADVAASFARALSRSVELNVVPPARWRETLQSFGFSPPAAASMAAMTDLTLREPFEPDAPIRGTTTLDAYIRGLVS